MQGSFLLDPCSQGRPGRSQRQGIRRPFQSRSRLQPALPLSQAPPHTCRLPELLDPVCWQGQATRVLPVALAKASMPSKVPCATPVRNREVPNQQVGRHQEPELVWFPPQCWRGRSQRRMVHFLPARTGISTPPIARKRKSRGGNGSSPVLLATECPSIEAFGWQ